MSKKILIATPLYPPEIGGPATYAKELCEGLPGRGIEVSLLKFSGVRHFPKVIRHYVYYRRVLRALRDSDAVLALDPVSVGFPAMKAAKKLNKPFVVKIVGDYAWEQGVQRFGVTQDLDEFVKTKQSNFFVQKLQNIQKQVAMAAAKIIVPSEYLKKIVMAWGIPSEKIKVIYNAVPLETLGQVPEGTEALSRPYVVTVGRLVPWKNINKIIDAVWAVRREGKELSLIVVGDGPERKRLEAQANSLLKKNFLFTGNLSHPDALAVMGFSDIFVLNSSYEGLSHVLIEAMSLGVPTIVTNVGGNTEVAIANSSILIKLNDQGGLTSSLLSLVSDAEGRSRYSAAAKKSSERFSVETMILQTADFLKKL